MGPLSCNPERSSGSRRWQEDSSDEAYSKMLRSRILHETMMTRILSLCWLLLISVQSTVAQEAEIAQIFIEEDVERYEEASQIYLQWIGATTDPDVKDHDALKRHLQWIALITSDKDVKQSAQLLVGDIGISEDAQRIISWWHRQDPLPATLINERIEEHLYRVYYAQENYAYRKDSLGVDDRGRIFVKYGQPWRQEVITLKDIQLRVLPFEFRLPRNEIWVYRGIHDDAHFLFVQRSRRRPYKIETSESLIPTNLRSSRRRIGILFAWMEDVYGQLAMQHDHYGSMYDAVSGYTSLPTAVPYQPFEFSHKIIHDSQVKDDQHQRRREETLPVSQTRVYGNTIQLNPEIRFSRFLESDGSTRVEAYWTIDVRDLRPSRYMRRRSRQLDYQASSDYILSVGLTTRGNEFEPQNIQIRRYHLPEGSNSTPRIYSSIIPNFSTSTPISLQWSLHWTVPDSIPPLPDVTWAIGTMNLDTLDALKGDGLSLELSDLKPLVMESPNSFIRSTPFVNRQISSDTPLALYFEAYFLRFNDVDQTNYTIEYSLSSQDTDRITTFFDYEGGSATIREFIAIDLSQWNTPGPFTLTLKVTDQIAQSSVARSIDLEYVE